MIHFYKYHGTGNDFVVLDARNLTFDLSPKLIESLCHRRFGIGADGVITIANKEGYDFEMFYYNSDGFIGPMCGNGARCATHFAAFLGIIENSAQFTCNQKNYRSKINPENGHIEVDMLNIEQIKRDKRGLIIDVDCPHLILFEDPVSLENAFSKGKELRYHDDYKERGGININFVTGPGNDLSITTYERGIEDITWACGTGAIAAAAAKRFEDKEKSYGPSSYMVKSLGGTLKISFDYDGNTFTNVKMEGPAVMVFEGTISIKDFK